MHFGSDAVNCVRRFRAVIAARAGALVLLLPALLLAVAVLPVFSEDETARFQFNLDSAQDAIRMVERELNRFDGQSGASRDLKEAADTYRDQMWVLRTNADRHTLAPPSLGGIITACAGIEQPSPYDRQLEALRRASDRETEEFKTHTSAFLQTRTALNQLVANKSLQLWLSMLPVDTGATLVQLVDTVFGVVSVQAGFPAGTYVQRHQAELTRRMNARAKATGLTKDSPRIGFVFAAYKELALLAKQNYERSEKLVKALEAQRRTMEERAAAYEKVKAEYLALCGRITSEPGWRPGTPTPPTTNPPAPPPSLNPVPPTTTPPAPGPVEVPHITGWARENAEREIQGAGLAVGSVTTAASSHVPAGSVIDQSPVGGTRVAPGAAIALVVSRGPSQPGQLIVEPASVALEIGETVEFAAKAVYDDGSVQYFTYGSTWTPGPDHKFTATRQGTYTITATFQGLTGQAVVRVGGRDYTPPVLPPDDIDLPEAPPQEYTWYALCRPSDGGVSYGQHVNATTHRILGGPFPGPRSTRSWIDEQCPSWRCTSSGVCSQGQPTGGDGVGDWFVLCNPQSRAVGVSTNRHAPGQRVMAGPFLGEPEARSWTDSSCPSWLCDGNGACVAGTTPGTDGGNWPTGAGTTPGTDGGNWPTGPVGPPGGGDEDGWDTGPPQTINTTQPTLPPQPLPPPPPAQDATPFIEAAKREAAACRYPAALSYANQLAQVSPGHPWLAANHAKLQDLASRQEAAVREMNEGQAKLGRKDFRAAGKAAQRAAQQAPSCMRDLIEGFGEAARQAQRDDMRGGSKQQQAQKDAAAKALPGLIDMLNRAIEAQNPPPRKRDPGNRPPTGGGSGPKTADPCENKATYLNKWNPTPRCDCSGYKWNGYKCVPGAPTDGGPLPTGNQPSTPPPSCASTQYKLIDPPPYSGVSIVCSGSTGGTWLQTAGGMHKVVSIRQGQRNKDTGCFDGSEVVTEGQTYGGTLCGP